MTSIATGAIVYDSGFDQCHYVTTLQNIVMPLRYIVMFLRRIVMFLRRIVILL